MTAPRVDPHLVQAALEGVVDAVVIADLDGRIVHVNPAFERLTGWTRAEAVGQRTNLLRSGLVPLARYEELWSTILAGRSWSGELVNRRKDGSLYTERQTIGPVRDPSGAITHFVAIKRDVTLELATAQGLAEKAELFAQASEAMVLLGPDGRVRSLNAAAGRLFGCTELEARERRFTEVVGGAEALLDAGLERALAEGACALELQLPASTPGGPPRAIEARFSVVRGPDQRPSSLVLLASDVTETRELRREALRAQRQETLGELAAAIAHDLNNLLTPILSDANFLRDFLDDPEAREALDGMRTSAERASGVVRQILSFARGSHGEPRPTALGPLLEQTEKILRETLPRDVSLELTIDPELADVIADPTQLDQIVMNLCVNARDALDGGGALRLLCTNVELDPLEAPSWPELRTTHAVELVVEDTGRGIPAQHLPRIFEPFFTTKPDGRGTGLGLATVQRIVKAHGGGIRVSSEPGRGTRFTIRLPADTCAGARQVAMPTREPRRGAGEAILVVEDEAVLRAAFARTLRRAGYEVLEAADGIEALALLGLEGDRLRLVVLDLWMPELDGRAVLRVVRRMRPGLRVVLATGEPFDRSVPLAELHGAGELLRKPFGARALLEAVERQLQPQRRGVLSQPAAAPAAVRTG